MPIPRSQRSRIARPRRPQSAKWIKLVQRIENLEGTWGDGDILNLPGWRTIRYKETKDDIIILAELTTEATGHCKCGDAWAEMRGWGYTDDPMHVIDIPIRCKRTRIYYKLKRKRCLVCKTTFQQPTPWIDERHTMLTYRLVEYIGWESLNIFRNFSGIADEVGCSHILIRNIHREISVQLEKDRNLEAPRWIAFDEVHPQRYGPTYCVITAPEVQRALDLIKSEGDSDKKKSKNKKTQKGVDSLALFRWLLNLKNPDKVEVVTIDMWLQYKNLARRFFKNAYIVVDRYHVHNLLSVALKGVLRVLRDSMTLSEQRKLMRREALVLKNYRHLSDEKEKDEKKGYLPSEKDVFKKWLESIPDLATAYYLVKDFSDILQLYDRQKAEDLTDAWLERVCDFVKYFRSKYEKNYRGYWEDPFGNVANTITEWRVNILNYIDLKKLFEKKPTNAFAEFANNQIKKAFQIGNGYSFEVLRAKVVHGGVLVVKRPPYPLDQKWTRSKSDRGARRGPKKQREVNPNSNVALLESARISQDKTRNLLPEPQQTAGWIERFPTAGKDNIADSDEVYMELVEEFEAKEKEVARKGRRGIKFDPRQRKMF
jgi:transposase